MLDYLMNLIDSKKKEDRKLLSDFLNDFPPDGSIDYIANLPGDIWDVKKAYYTPRKLGYEWCFYVDHEFHDKRVEEKKKFFCEKLGKYLEYFSLHTFPHGLDINFCEVSFRNWEEGGEDWFQKREKYLEVLNEITDLAIDVVEAYKDLVRLAKRRTYSNRWYLWLFATLLSLGSAIIGAAISLLTK
jgi:hypothetical protein